jgi:rSAM/selenodomain-associated transferase 1
MGRLAIARLLGGLWQPRRVVVDRSASSQFLVIMVRSPHDKQVKSRLAATLGEGFATNFYRCCTEHIVQETGLIRSPVQRHVFYTTGDEDAVRHWLGHRFHFAPQGEGALGERLEHIFATVFSQGAERAVVIATDVPELSRDIMNEAIAALDSADLTIGPCRDGGYYLLGMKSPHPELLGDIPWSTERVYEETVRRVRAGGLSLHVLPVLRDIDTENDLREWLASRTGHERWTTRLAKECPTAAAAPKEGRECPVLEP